eukprot:5914129-Pyramimonas_sp.AAC.1
MVSLGPPQPLLLLYAGAAYLCTGRRGSMYDARARRSNLPSLRSVAVHLMLFRSSLGVEAAGDDDDADDDDDDDDDGGAR